MKILLTDGGTYVDGVETSKTVDELIEQYGVNACRQFGVISYQLTMEVARKILVSRNIWSCGICPIIDGSVPFTATVDEYESKEKLYDDCISKITEMQTNSKLRQAYLVFSHMVGQWLSVALDNRWLQKYNGEINFNGEVTEENVTFMPEVDGENGSCILRDLSDREASFGIIDIVDVPDGTFDIATYARVSSELQKKGCAIYGVRIDGDVNSLSIIGGCSKEGLVDIMEEITAFKDFSDHIGYIGYCDYHDRYVTDIADYNDAK